jgi:hypothetical protein
VRRRYISRSVFRACFFVQSRQKALEDLRNIGEKVEILSERQSQPVSQLKFITEALQQVGVTRNFCPEA